MRLCAALILAVCGGCGPNPESALLGRWTEVDWSYEKLDLPGSEGVRWIDNIAFPIHSEGRIVRHEAEWWEFREGGDLVIHKVDGTQAKARWRLKGRGHVLRLETEDSPEYELYDVKELSEGELILNYDTGMEVRGIARLRFQRLQDEPALRAAR